MYWFLIVGVTRFEPATLLFLDKVPILIFLFKGYYFQEITLLKMMKLAIVFLPIVFAIIWMLFIGLRINRRDENKKLINY
mgnify:CR=1 FL=1